MNSYRISIIGWFGVLLVILSVTLPTSGQSVIYVDPNAPGSTHDGSSWTGVYNTLQNVLAFIRVNEELYSSVLNNFDVAGFLLTDSTRAEV